MPLLTWTRGKADHLQLIADAKRVRSFHDSSFKPLFPEFERSVALCGCELALEDGRVHSLLTGRLARRALVQVHSVYSATELTADASRDLELLRAQSTCTASECHKRYSAGQRTSNYIIPRSPGDLMRFMTTLSQETKLLPILWATKLNDIYPFIRSDIPPGAALLQVVPLNTISRRRLSCYEASLFFPRKSRAMIAFAMQL
jgi:hypothetical protein